MFNVKKSLIRGISKLYAEQHHSKSEEESRLRGGNTGCISSDYNTSWGSCVRKAHLRQLGIELLPDVTSMLMFDGGYSNEADVSRYLDADGVPYKREGDCPTSWQTSTDVAVTGSPDYILEEGAEGGARGIELKQIAGVTTALDVLEGRPKTANLMQSAHYSWQNNYMPWSLVYINRCYFTKLEKFRVIPRLEKAPASFGKAVYFGKVGGIQPFISEVELFWEESGEEGRVLHYRSDACPDKTVATNITSAAIERYYEVAAKLGETQKLGPRPSNLSALGDKKDFSPCGLCEYKDVCDAYEDNYEEWLDNMKLFVDDRNKSAE